jgi:hypothetical protein
MYPLLFFIYAMGLVSVGYTLLRLAHKPMLLVPTTQTIKTSLRIFVFLDFFQYAFKSPK